MDLLRIWRHLTVVLGTARTLYDRATLRRLQDRIAAGEAAHRGEVRLIVESALPLRKIHRGMSPRQRALDLFGTFRAWDTTERNGVLLYVNVADRALEIIADRGASREAGDQQWLYALGLAQDEIRRGDFEAGIAVAIDAIHRGLTAAFPADAARSAVVAEPALR